LDLLGTISRALRSVRRICQPARLRDTFFSRFLPPCPQQSSLPDEIDVADAIESDDSLLRRYTQALLEDVRAFERMLDEGCFESGIRCIGAEQEMFLVDAGMHPAPKALEVLEAVGDDALVNELALFNLEANTPPRAFGGSCLAEMESDLRRLAGAADQAARDVNCRIMLTGILPTLRLSDLSLGNMTPKDRYFEINEATGRARGGKFDISIKGRDDLDVSHDNVMLESCNTSLQLHFQVGQGEFAKLYNMAQAITAPVLAAAVNSPLLLGRQLWDETRIALFQSSVDSRSVAERQRQVRPRVSFGDAWVKQSAAEVWRENITRHRMLFVADMKEDPMAVLDAGGIPEFTALRLHNGTVYRWNRVCYGHDGITPHLRIENRVLPAGPTIADEMANSAFYFGLMAGCTEEYGNVHERMSFEDARNNFFSAARHGLSAQFHWVDGEVISASKLILEHLLPLAAAGLDAAGIDKADSERHLGVLEARVISGRTGSDWVRRSLDAMGTAARVDTRHRTLVKVMIERQDTEQPVHSWDLAGPADLERVTDWSDSYRFVSQLMTSDVFTVRPGDLVDLAASLMDWEHLRHVPVEDDQGQLVGLLSHRALLRMVAKGARQDAEPTAVRELMTSDPVTISSSSSTLEAVELMRAKNVGCLPVVAAGRLVGIITESDYLAVAARLLDERLGDE